MFSKKKSIFERKSFYAGIALAAVAVFSIGWLLTPADDGTETDKDAVQQSSQAVVKNNKTEREDNIKDGLYLSDEKRQESGNDAYYLIKEENGLIKVYRNDSDDNEKLVKTTDISYSLLCEEDQNMFSKGIIVKTEEELMNLLQDFES